MKKGLLLFFVINTIIVSAQNVGVGTTTPAEKLDVNGNINVAGTIKANGADGTAGQVLMKNGSGDLAWGDVTEFKNMATFTATGANNWIVPAGITRIMVEIWGGGGGGGAWGGGGGGGYVRGIFTVAPTDNISFNVGLGGTGASDGTNGGMTTLTAGAVTLTAFGGQGCVFVSPQITANSGGQYSVTAGFTNFWGIRGDAGTPKNFSFIINGATTYSQTMDGNGGDAGNTKGTGGLGRKRIYNVTAAADSFYGFPDSGKQPGGGGGSGVGGLLMPTTGIGVAGGAGMVIIHY
jgi:hypothetical protein